MSENWTNGELTNMKTAALIAAVQRLLNISEHPLVNWPDALPIDEIRQQVRDAMAELRHV